MSAALSARSVRHRRIAERAQREKYRQELIRIWTGFGFTHEELEAMSLAEIIAHRNAGHFERPTLPGV